MVERQLLRAATFVVSLLLLVLPPSLAQPAELKEAVEQLGAQLAKSVPEGRIMRVAVTDIPDLEGVTSNLGRYIAERLTTRLSALPQKFRVIERRRLGQVLGELRFSMSDLVDPAKAKQLGKMLGVEALVVGTVSDLGNVVEVDARIIEIETNNTLPGVTAAISKDETVRRMIQEGRTAEAATRQLHGAPSTTASTPASDRRIIKIKDGMLELVSAEIVGDRYTLRFLYTNLGGKAEFQGMAFTDRFMLDNLGNRYRFVDDQFPPEAIPPNVPVKVSLSFQAPETRASHVHVFFTLRHGGSVELRDLPVVR